MCKKVDLGKGIWILKSLICTCVYHIESLSSFPFRQSEINPSLMVREIGVKWLIYTYQWFVPYPCYTSFKRELHNYLYLLYHYWTCLIWIQTRPNLLCFKMNKVATHLNHIYSRSYLSYFSTFAILQMSKYPKHRGYIPCIEHGRISRR